MKRSYVLSGLLAAIFVATLLVSLDSVGGGARTHYWAIDQDKCVWCEKCVEIAPDCFEEDAAGDKAAFINPGCCLSDCSTTCGLFGSDIIDAANDCPVSAIENVGDCN